MPQVSLPYLDASLKFFAHLRRPAHLRHDDYRLPVGKDDFLAGTTLACSSMSISPALSGDAAPNQPASSRSTKGVELFTTHCRIMELEASEESQERTKSAIERHISCLHE